MSASPLPRSCVVGWPISHSRSPLIHRYWLKANGIEGDYDRVAVPPGELPRFVATIGHDGLRGANVTVPHKEAAFAACDRLTDAARAIGAVNTLWRDDGLLFGDNTDAFGFLGNLDERAPAWRDRLDHVVILGAGGAARAAVHALLGAGAGQIVLVNRGFERAAALAAAFGPKVSARSWTEITKLLPIANLLVNTTSLGMVGQPPLEIDVSALAPSATVCDIVYMPLRTPLIEEAARLGHPVVDGLGMLLHQAVSGFERWFGVRPKVTPELRALLEDDILQAGRKPK